MKIKEKLLYTKTHEWVEIKGDIAYVGITDFAQDALGNIVYFEAVDVGDGVLKGQTSGTIESVKAAEDLLSPLSGVIVEVNDDVVLNPEKLNEEPYDNWLYKIRYQSDTEVEELLTAQDYEKVCLDA